MNIIELVAAFAVKAKASDIHLTEGKKPLIRLNGKLISLDDFPEFTREDFITLKKTQGIREEWLEKLSYDGAIVVNGNRFRLHVFQSLTGWAISLRLIPTEIPIFDNLNLPEVIKTFSYLKNGLVLVTGVTGSGKSTTLASIINMINLEQSKRIITIEDPIEFVYKEEKSSIIQRERGENFYDFSMAVREAMRQDPDIIVVGELRDLETIQNAITLAETGHLVFGTLHTKSVAESFDRMIDVFPADQQKQIRFQVSNTVAGIVSQRLVQKSGGGRTPLTEVLVMNSAIKNTIQSGASLSQIEDQLLMNHHVNGSQTFTQALAFLVKQKLITEQTAFDEAGSLENKEKLTTFLND